MPGKLSAKKMPTLKTSVKAKSSNSRLTRDKNRKESYTLYLYKVLKQVHPNIGVSSKAMSIMNSIVNDLFEKIAVEAGRLAYYSVKSSITPREVQTAVRILLPEELSKNAVEEGTKAVIKYNK